MASLLFLSSDILLGFVLTFDGAVILLDGEPGLKVLLSSSSDSTASFFFGSHLSVSPSNRAKGRWTNLSLVFAFGDIFFAFSVFLGPFGLLVLQTPTINKACEHGKLPNSGINRLKLSGLRMGFAAISQDKNTSLCIPGQLRSYQAEVDILFSDS